MKGCTSGCLRSVGLLVLALGIAYAGWRWGAAVFPRLEAWFGRDTTAPAVAAPDVRQPSVALADSTLDRVERFRSGADGDELALDGAELSSVLRHALPGILPPGVGEPTVDLDGESVWLSARIELAAIPNLSSVGDMVAILPDTVRVRLRGVVLPLSPGWAAFQVERVEAERFPLPSGLIPGVLTALGRRDRAGLPARALAVPLPEGLDRVQVVDGRMILLAEY